MGTTWGPNAPWLTRHPGLPVPWESLSPPHSITDDGFYFVHSLHSTIFIPVCSNEINKLFWQPHLLRKTIRKKKKTLKRSLPVGLVFRFFSFFFDYLLKGEANLHSQTGNTDSFVAVLNIPVTMLVKRFRGTIAYQFWSVICIHHILEDYSYNPKTSLCNQGSEHQDPHPLATTRSTTGMELNLQE